MKNKSSLLQVPLATIVFGFSMLIYALLNPPDLAMIGFSVSVIAIGVAAFCYWMWHNPVGDLHDRDAYIGEIAYNISARSNQYLTAIKWWLKWKWHACAKFPQFWAMFIWIMYCGALSLVSMYLASLPPPCDARQDCQQTESRGIYTHE